MAMCMNQRIQDKRGKTVDQATPRYSGDFEYTVTKECGRRLVMLLRRQFGTLRNLPKKVKIVEV